MSLPRNLSSRVIARICDRFRLTESLGDGGGPLMTLRSAMSPEPVGAMRVFTGGPLDKMVSVSLVVPPIGLDSHMVFAFTPPDSPVPHFTVDAVHAGPHYAFHLDLIPRADLGAHLGYMNAVLEPLTTAFQAAQSIAGLSPAQLAPRQRALMSPWMLAYRADAAAFEAAGNPVGQYLDHWFSLVERGVSPEITSGMPATWAARDRLNRAALFSPAVDPVWAQVDRLLGAEPSARIRHLLQGS